MRDVPFVGVGSTEARVERVRRVEAASGFVRDDARVDRDRDVAGVSSACESGGEGERDGVGAFFFATALLYELAETDKRARHDVLFLRRHSRYELFPSIWVC